MGTELGDGGLEVGKLERVRLHRDRRPRCPVGKTRPKAAVQAMDRTLPTERGSERGLDSIFSFGTDFARDGGRSPTRGRSFSRASRTLANRRPHHHLQPHRAADATTVRVVGEHGAGELDVTRCPHPWPGLWALGALFIACV